jgi:hypothetical protein
MIKAMAMEQQLINAFMKLTAKLGAGEWIKDLIQQVDVNGNPKAWTPAEIEKATIFLHQLNDRFGKAEALRIIKTLIRKFDIDSAELQGDEDYSETHGVQGLQ